MKRKKGEKSSTSKNESDLEINNKNETLQVKNNFDIKIVNDTKVGVCKLCKHLIKMTNSNTSGLRRHLQRNHAKVYETIFRNFKSLEVSSK